METSTILQTTQLIFLMEIVISVSASLRFVSKVPIDMAVLLRIESTKTTSMEDISTGVIEKIKNI